MTSRTLALVLLLAALVLPAQAQPADAVQPLTHVHFAVDAEFSSISPEGQPVPLPIALLEQLERQAALVDLKLMDGGQRLRMELRFYFDDLAAFATWYESDETRALFEDIQSNAIKQLVTALQMQREPAPRHDG